MTPARLLLAVALALAAAPAAAQSATDVSFPPGSFGTTVSGSITGSGYADYRLSARAGQELSAEIVVEETDGNGSVFFNVLPPGSDDVAIFNGSTASDGAATVALPQTGVYTVRAYLMGNDHDTDRTVSDRIDLSIQ